jgi:hypothetical protein
MKADEVYRRLLGRPLKSGFRNCHHMGLTSVVLDEREDGTLSRIFYAEPNCTMDRIFRPDGHMVIGAHNHDKPIRFTRLFGNPRHVSLFTDYPGVSPRSLWFRYPFESAINSGESGLLDPRAFQVEVSIHDLDNTYMDTRQVHTVLTSPMSAWHCDEFPKEDVKKHVWSPLPGLKLDSRGLYVAMAEAELEQTRQALISAMEGASQ